MLSIAKREYKMSYTAPNTFTASTVIESAKVQENIDELRNYVNGEIVSTDLSTAEWVEPKHIMKGLYNPIINRYAMESGLCGGHPTFPVFHPGYFGERYHSLGGSGRATLPNCSVEFYLEAPAKVLFYYTISPRPLAPLDTSTPTRLSISLRVNGSAVNTAQNTFTEQIEMNTTGGVNEGIVSPYRRRTYSFQTIQELPAGEHNFELVGQSGSTSVPLKFYTYSIQAFY